MSKLQFSRGTYLRRMYLIPTIELERIEDGRNYLVIAFLKWYFGLFWDSDGKLEVFYE